MTRGREAGVWGMGKGLDWYRHLGEARIKYHGVCDRDSDAVFLCGGGKFSEYFSSFLVYFSELAGCVPSVSGWCPRPPPPLLPLAPAHPPHKHTTMLCRHGSHLQTRHIFRQTQGEVGTPST